DRLDPWLGRPEGDCTDEVTLSLKGAKSPTRGRKLRSTGTKARAHVSNEPTLIELKEQLEARTRELAEARGQLSEALEQQGATSEILRVIASSPTDLQQVLNALAETAARVCGATDATMRRVEGNVLKTMAHYGAIPALDAGDPLPLNRGSVGGRAI